MSNSTPDINFQANELMPDFDEKTMEFGRAPEQYIAEKFIIENGIVKNIEPSFDEPDLETLEEARERSLHEFHNISFSQRRIILPDYKLQNVSLGIYSEEKAHSYKATVEAFREEYKRLEKELNNASSIEDVDAIEPRFPTKILIRETK